MSSGVTSKGFTMRGASPSGGGTWGRSLSDSPVSVAPGPRARVLIRGV